jgi:glycosyltransferase involved in cell wall biosynthesis
LQSNPNKFLESILSGSPLAYPKIVAITPFAGIVKRGAERTVDDFQKRLSGEVYVISLAGCRAPGGNFPELERAKEHHAFVNHYFRWLNWIDHHIFRGRLHLLVGTYHFISTNQLLDYILSRRLPAILDIVKPQAVIALAGYHSHRVLSRYCRRKNIVLIGFFGGGPGSPMRVMARTLNQGIAATTPLELDYIRRTEPKIKSVLIPMGVDVRRFLPPSGSEASLLELESLQRPIFFSASALEPYKRLDLLIDAVSLAGRGSLVLSSDGSRRTDLLRQAAQQLGRNRFYYAGVVSDDLLVRLHQSADVYCLPSRNEPFGNVLLEAMACGKPIVSTDDATRRWIVSDAGILVDVTHRKAFADALCRAADTDWGEKPRCRAEFFSLENVAATWSGWIASSLADRNDYVSPYEKALSE